MLCLQACVHPCTRKSCCTLTKFSGPSAFLQQHFVLQSTRHCNCTAQLTGTWGMCICRSAVNRTGERPPRRERQERPPGGSSVNDGSTGTSRTSSQTSRWNSRNTVAAAVDSSRDEKASKTGRREWSVAGSGSAAHGVGSTRAEEDAVDSLPSAEEDFQSDSERSGFDDQQRQSRLLRRPSAKARWIPWPERRRFWR